MNYGGSYIDPTGREPPCFNLPKRETTILVSGYSVASALASSTAGWNCRKQLQYAVQGSKSVPECASNFGETSAQVEMPSGDMGILDFQETPYIHPQNRQTYRSFEMDRNGFTLLLIGFTGNNRITPAIRKHAVLDRDPTAGRLPAS